MNLELFGKPLTPKDPLDDYSRCFGLSTDQNTPSPTFPNTQPPIPLPLSTAKISHLAPPHLLATGKFNFQNSWHAIPLIYEEKSTKHSKRQNSKELETDLKIRKLKHQK